MIPFLNDLLGKLYSRGRRVEPRGGLNIGAGLLLTPTSIGYEMTPDPAMYTGVQIRGPNNQGGSRTVGEETLQAAGVQIAEAQSVRIEVHCVSRDIVSPPAVSSDMYVKLSAFYRRVGAAAPVLLGSVSTTEVLRDAGAAGRVTPVLQVSGNAVVLVCEGTAGQTIQYWIDFVHQSY